MALSKDHPIIHWFLCLDNLVKSTYSFQDQFGTVPFLYLILLLMLPLLLIISLPVTDPTVLKYHTIVLPPVPPWRCLPGRHYKGIHHYHLRQRCQKRFPLLRRPRFVPAALPPKKSKLRQCSDQFQPPPHWKHYSEEERLEDYDRMQHRWLHQSFIMIEAQYGISLDAFLATQDPAGFIHDIKALAHHSFLDTDSARSARATSAAAAKIAALQIRQTLEAHSSWPLGTTWFPSTALDTAVEHMRVYHNPTTNPDADLPIVIDSGASISITPNIRDFIGKIEPCKMTALTGLTNTTPVVGRGIVHWDVVDIFGVTRAIKTTAYYVPDATIRLYSPQAYFQEHQSGSLLMDHRRTKLFLADGSCLEFPYNHGNNLPLMLPDQILMAGLTYGDVDFMTSNASSIHMSVTAETTQNLTASQRELLLWHHRLGHGNFQWIQRLFAQRPDHLTGTSTSILHAKAPSVSSCPLPLCAACQMAKQTRRTPARGSRTAPPEGVLRSNHLQPGDKVSVDQYISALPGRLRGTYGKESPKQQFHGGTIFVDHATQYVSIHNQVSLKVGETLRSKHAFERTLKAFGHTVQSYRADNVPFNSDGFRHDIEVQDQTIDFSGVGAHHQNGVSERTIQTVTMWARALLLHALIHWPDQANLRLWPFALQHAAYLYNHMPNQRSLLSPMELLSGCKDDHTRLQRSHVWGCPVYVLDPKLQDGKKLPKWNPRARRGQYLGQSPEHSSTIGDVLNLRTGWVSPQYHVVYDDQFTTVPNAESGGLLDLPSFSEHSWTQIVTAGLERHIDSIEFDGSGCRRLPELHNDWLTDLEIRLREHQRYDRRQRHERRQLRHPHPPPQAPRGGLPAEIPNTPNQQEPIDVAEAAPNIPDEDDFVAGDIPGSDEENNDELSLPDIPVANDEVDILPPPLAVDQPAVRPIDALEPPLGRGARRPKPNPRFFDDSTWINYNGKSKFHLEQLNKQRLNMLNWARMISTLESTEFKKMWKTSDIDPDGECHWMHPMILAAKANSEDNPTWDQAMSGPLADGYWKAAQTEIETLERKHAWDVVDRTPDMNVLPSTWAFKCKRFPNGDVRKLKGRLCVRGDKQVQDVDFFETFAPVVSWNTVRLMLIMSLIMGLATKQVDYTAAFVQAPIDEDVFVEMPRGFSQPRKVLKLKRSLYGLKQSPRNFFQFLKGNLERIGFRNNQDIDPCLFISDKCIVLVYVDDTLFYAPRQEYIDEAIEKLRGTGMELEPEDSVAGFLGVHIHRDESDQSITLTQEGLTRRIIDALAVTTRNKPIKYTPATREPLTIDKDGDPPDGLYNYASVVGMLQYLQAHSRPDISYAVSQVARFTYNTRRSHEEALERIGQYLRGTITKGLVLRPTGRFDIDCYVDADFCGLWPFEDKSNPTSVKSRTGFVICISDCPVIWTSKLQDLICLSTMEAEYCALSTAMKEVIPLRRLFKSIGTSIGISENYLTQFKTTVHEDNNGALTLANLEPGRHTPRSKHFAVRLHWFRSHLKPNEVEIVPIKTSHQRADILTKGLTKQPFESIRKQLCGW